MVGLKEMCLLATAALLLVGALIPRLRLYRSLFLAGGVLLLITALYPRADNGLGQYLFGKSTGTPRLPLELFGIAWWILGAWLIKSLLNLLLRRTIFPNDNEPHARRLFADLASALIYVLALIGIMDSVFKTPLSGVLATSGVLAIVLGLALQNTLADVFSGLAINIERPFGAGDWISMPNHVEGQVIEINWRATRIKTGANDLIVIPNSVIAKAIVTNHRRLYDPYICTLQIKIDHRILPAQVIDVLESAAADCPNLAAGAKPLALAGSFSEGLINYELSFAVEDYLQNAAVQSAVISRIVARFKELSIQIGTEALDIRLIRSAAAVVELTAGKAMNNPPKA